MEESLNDLLIRAARLLYEATQKAAPYNDFGSALGIIDEATHLTEDLTADLHRACRRARDLTRRIEKWEAGHRDVLMLRDCANAPAATAKDGKEA